MIRTVRIANGVPTSSWVTAWTVPNGHSSVAKTLVVQATGATPSFQVQVVPKGTNASDAIPFTITNLVTNDVVTREMQMAISEGDKVQVKGTNVVFYLSGIDSDVT